MKTLTHAIAICLFALSPVIASAAIETSALDQALIDDGLVGQDYKYKDINAADKYFNNLTIEFAKSLPVRSSPAVEAKSVTITPYFSEYVHRYTVDFPAESLSSLKYELSNPLMLKRLCRDVYGTKKFFAANDHTIVFTYQKKDGQKLTDVIMNNATCNA